MPSYLVQVRPTHLGAATLAFQGLASTLGLKVQRRVFDYLVVDSPLALPALAPQLQGVPGVVKAWPDRRMTILQPIYGAHHRVPVVPIDLLVQRAQSPFSAVAGSFFDAVSQIRGTSTGAAAIWPTELSRKAVGADVADADGISGKGIKVAVLDTGFDPGNEQIFGLRGESMVQGQPLAVDENGHSTHVTTTIAGKRATNPLGKGAALGVATGSELIIIKVLGYLLGFGSFSAIMAGMERAANLGANVVSMSLGGDDSGNHDPDQPEFRAVRLLTERGIVVSLAAGNSGPGDGTTGVPGGAPDALTVGAIDSTGEIAYFSSRGPTKSLGLMKPDVVAPGVNILSTTTGIIALERLQDGPRWAAISGTCLSGDSRVFTNPDGPVAIKDMRPGAHVYAVGEDGKLTKHEVKAVLSNGVRPLVRLTLKDREIVATGDHPVLTLCKTTTHVGNKAFPYRRWSPSELVLLMAKREVSPLYLQALFPTRSYASIKRQRQHLGLPRLSSGTWTQWSLQWRRINELSVGDSVVALKESPGLTEVEESVSFARLLGFMIGDGWVSPNKRSWLICFAAGDKPAIASKYSDLFRTLFGLTPRLEKTARWHYSYSKVVGEQLRSWGVRDGALGKRIDQRVFTWPKGHREAFLQGYIDADGHRGNGRWELESPNDGLIQDFHLLALSVGWKVGLVRHRTKLAKAPNQREAHWANLSSVSVYPTRHRFGTELRHTGRHPELNELLDWDAFLVRTVKDITPAGEGEVFDIEVEGAHNFLANGVVVHNSMATPHVSAVVALGMEYARRKGGTLTTADIKQAMQRAGRPKDNTYGWGLITYPLLKAYIDGR